MSPEDFIRARLDEEQALAEAATQAPWWYDRTAMWLDGEDFVTFDHGKGQEFIGYGERPLSGAIAITGPAGHRQSMADAAHIAAQDPARTLRRVAAMRAVLAAHPRTSYIVGYGSGTKDFGCENCHDWDGATEGHGDCDTLLALAAIWSDHPDYNPEWSLT